ncbi:hypothetical protein GCM10011519_22120 [Marmoricola endophyticus]|uniref:DUF4265 domain-containing protein n=1 Tax=Marmoricola endophyticus TaxID=2040280 RepID=A0A917BJ01_9ACTN|nr:DUF4265 domain-containing protein [Marmoricola endophyticus]GGF47646.1 hypothetical protein GCM10011519_22120 [Marmoricola endophyticus]
MGVVILGLLSRQARMSSGQIVSAGDTPSPMPHHDLVEDMVRVRFGMEQDDSGWPPVTSEGLWAWPVGPSQFKLDNTPWFVRGVAADDIVEAEQDDEGVWWCTRVLEAGGRVVVRVIPRLEGPLKGDRQAVLDAFAPLGVEGEGIAEPVSIVALDISPATAADPVKRLLERGHEDGWWHYEEGCVTDDWLASG